MITKIQIRDIFSDFAADHLQIDTFDYSVNHLWEVDKQLDSNGVVMWVNSVTGGPTGETGKNNKRNYQVFIMDVVNDEKDNSAEIESDTEQIGLDLLSHLAFFDFEEFEAKNGVGRFSLDRQFTTIEPFRENFKSLYCGNLFEISLNVSFNYNTCQIPTNG